MGRLYNFAKFLSVTIWMWFAIMGMILTHLYLPIIFWCAMGGFAIVGIMLIIFVIGVKWGRKDER